MDKTIKYSAIKIEENKEILCEEELVCEYPLNIYANQKKIATLLCTPDKLKELAIGFLRTEEIIHKKEDIESIELDEFKANEKALYVEIGNNHFSKKEIEVHLENDLINLHGKLMFEDLQQIGPQPIMGPFGNLNFLECYHGLISMRHSISGKMIHNGREINFNQGRGYIEKDWGKSFPKHYIWMQANHFMNDEASFMLSIADIPFKLFSFNGFLCSVLINQKEYRFATYTDAKIKSVEETESGLHIRLTDRKYILDVWANHSESSDLKAPKMGLMSGIIKEGLDSEIKIRLVSNEEIIYEEKSRFGSIERFEDEKFLHKWGTK